MAAALHKDLSTVRIIGATTESELIRDCRAVRHPRPAVAALWDRLVPSATLIEKCCLIANPAAGNPTHYLVEQAFGQKGLDWRFMTFEVEPEQLGDAMRGVRALGFHGVKIGEPFQEAVIEHLDELTDAARRCGSVNCITATGERLVGDNTEGAALVELVRQQINPVGRRAMVIGAGRLARAIAMALAEAGMHADHDRQPQRRRPGRQLVELIQQQTTADGDVRSARRQPALPSNRIRPCW